MKYCSLEDVENYIGKNVASNFQPQIEKWIESISLTMNNMANRKLVCDEMGSGDEYETRYYDGNGNSYLLIGDCHSVQEVVVSDTFGDNTETIDTIDYVLVPKIAPHRAISFRNIITPIGQQNVSITGNFGLFTTIPEDIRFACAVFVAGIIGANSPMAKDKGSESIGSYSVSYGSEKAKEDYITARNIVLSYRKQTF
jgi:hypothetical protein